MTDTRELFELPDGNVVCCGGKWHGWLFRRYPDGQLVAWRKLKPAKPYPDDHYLAKLFGGSILPAANSSDR